MADFFRYTNPAARTTISKITGQAADAMQYSKIGKTSPETKASRIAQGVLGTCRLSQSEMAALEADIREIMLDLTQLGLTVVGLIEVAEPIQAGADLTNGAIDISRGHPIIGALSMVSALPVIGLIPGIGITVVRVFKCAYANLRFCGRVFIVLTTKSAKAVGKFIYLKRGALIKMAEDGRHLWDATAEIGEKMLKACRDFGEQMAKKPVTEKFVKGPDSHFKNWEEILKQPLHPANDVHHRTINRVQQQGKAIQQGRRDVNTYRTFPNTYGNLGPFRNTFK